MRKKLKKLMLFLLTFGALYLLNTCVPVIFISQGNVYVFGYGPPEDRSILGYGAVFKKHFINASWETMKDTATCNKYAKRYDKVGKMPMNESFRGPYLPRLTINAVLDGCWNESSSCVSSVYRLNHARLTLAEDFFPIHPQNYPEHRNWSYVDKMKYKELKAKADIELLEAQDDFYKKCKRTPLSDFLDNFRGY